MTISNAMQSGVSGLMANANAVSRISENIANTNTIGYKRTFAAMVTSTAGPTSGVRAEYGSDVSLQGGTKTSTNDTAMSIRGDGFFVVSKAPNDPNQANYMMTRAGDFKPDKDGHMVNSAGYFLAGFPYSEDGSTLSGVDRNSTDGMETVSFGGVQLTAEATSEASISGNLPSGITGNGDPQPPFVSTMSYYTDLGERDELTLNWTASDTTDNLWSLEVVGSDGTIYGTVDIDFHDSGATPAAPLSYTGNQDGGLAAPAAFSVDALGNMSITIDNATTPQTVEVALGEPGSHAGITQFAGDYEPQKFTVNGSEVSSLEKTEIDESGNVFGVFLNGQRRALFQIPVATVPSADNLQLVDGNAYTLTRESGPAVYNVAGTGGSGEVMANTLEQSNADIAQELTDLIQVQRFYSANAKIITTSDEMLQETTNMKR